MTEHVAFCSLELQLSPTTGQPLYLSILQSRGIYTRGYWFWLGAGVLLGYVILFNVLATFALQHLKRKCNFLKQWLLFTESLPNLQRLSMHVTRVINVSLVSVD